MRIFFKNGLGAGDHANLLPVLNYFVMEGYEVFTIMHPGNENLYLNTEIRNYNNQNHLLTVPVYCTSGRDIPATVLLSQLQKLKDISLAEIKKMPGIILSDKERVNLFNRHPYVNIFPYTTIKEKTVNINIIKPIVKFLKKRGFRVFTSFPPYDGKAKEEYPWEQMGCEFHSQTGYFSREWILDIAGATFNVCCDGGPLNVSLATGTKTFGLLSIADKSLCQFFSEERWEVVQSNIECSPCFKSANYETRMVKNCLSSDDPCGGQYDIDDVLKKLEDFIADIE